MHGAPIRSHRLLVAGSCPRVPVTSNRVGAVGWAKSLRAGTGVRSINGDFAHAESNRVGTAREILRARNIWRGAPLPTLQFERNALQGGGGRGRACRELHALVVERQTQRFQKPSSQDMGVQVSPSAPVAPVAEWQTRRSQKPLSLKTCSVRVLLGAPIRGCGGNARRRTLKPSRISDACGLDSHLPHQFTRA